MPPFYFLTFAKVSVSVSKTFGLKKSLGIGLENIWSRKKVSVSVSKIFGLEKKSRSRSRKFWSRKKVSVSVSMKFFGLVTQWLQRIIQSGMADTLLISSYTFVLHLCIHTSWLWICEVSNLYNRLNASHNGSRSGEAEGPSTSSEGLSTGHLGPILHYQVSPNHQL